MPPPVPFPRHGKSESVVVSSLQKKLGQNLYQSEKNFGIVYSGAPHPLAKVIQEIAEGTYIADWEQEMFKGTYLVEKEAVRMVGSLLGDGNVGGFITSGGTESNLVAMRVARDRKQRKRPEVILPITAHFSFRSAAELLGLKLRFLPVDANLHPDMNRVGGMINQNTIALVCSAPEGFLGVMDPVKEFAELAEKHNLYLHVDAAFGGFILPFMRELGYDIPPFDFRIPSVDSMMTDGHKLGLMPLTTSFFLLRRQENLKSIPTEDTVIHTITSTKPGIKAAAAWAIMNRMGMDGYKQSTRRVLGVVRILQEGIESIPGLELVMKPLITMLAFKSDVYDVASIFEQLRKMGWGTELESWEGAEMVRLSVNPNRDDEHAKLFVSGLRQAVKHAKKK